jgi:8-oxo-dGTP pyrophosphatase MutT (NUDIX family)
MQHLIPAATVVLMRQAAGGSPELLMIERAAGMAFAGGALVFPGGRVDPQDVELARLIVSPDLDIEERAARIAAIRETIEEVGIAIGLDPQPRPEQIAELRCALAAGGDLAGLLADAALRIDLSALVPFARWCPNLRKVRTFDTRFYLAISPADAVADADGGESVHALWARADEILALADAGERHVIFPTRRNLERLARFAGFEAARADAVARPVRTITPWIEEREGEKWLCIPDDQGYPVTAERLETVKRG